MSDILKSTIAASRTMTPTQPIDKVPANYRDGSQAVEVATGSENAQVVGKSPIEDYEGE